MVTWDKLGNEYNSDKDEGEAYMALMALIFCDPEYESNSDSESEE